MEYEMQAFHLVFDKTWRSWCKYKSLLSQCPIPNSSHASSSATITISMSMFMYNTLAMAVRREWEYLILISMLFETRIIQSEDIQLGKSLATCSMQTYERNAVKYGWWWWQRPSRAHEQRVWTRNSIFRNTLDPNYQCDANAHSIQAIKDMAAAVTKREPTTTTTTTAVVCCCLLLSVIDNHLAE